MPRDQLSAREARWLALGAQGLASARPPAGATAPAASQLRKLMGRVGTIQLDAVNVLERTQFLVPFSRLGPYERGDFRALSGPGRPWFEYWGHAASLLPVELHPLFRWQMERRAQDKVDGAAAQERRRAWRLAHAEYLAAVLQEVKERGPLAASQLSEPRRRDGEWWGRRSVGRQALEVLFSDGTLSAWRTTNFERVYDLTERVIPASVLERPTPSAEDAQRELVALAAQCMGVATVGDLADYFWLRPPAVAQRAAELVEAGRLIAVSVEGWPSPAYMLPGTRGRRPTRATGTLLSPFDSLIWRRERTERLFGMRYRIEIYVPAARREFGYYVLPMLLGDELVGRFDLKADRHSSALLVQGCYGEVGSNADAVSRAAAQELQALAGWLGLGRVVVAPKGDLAPVLSTALPAVGG